MAWWRPEPSRPRRSTADQRQALETTLRGMTGREVELQAEVDPQIMGGLVLEMEGRVYDGSVRARLGALREHLARGARRA